VEPSTGEHSLLTAKLAHTQKLSLIGLVGDIADVKGDKKAKLHSAA